MAEEILKKLLKNEKLSEDEEVKLARICTPIKFKSFPKQPRLINRFMLGADPEFVVGIKEVDDAVIRLVSASSLNLYNDTAWGADGSGRQIELRPMPSRSAFEVVANLAEALRGFAATVRTDDLIWESKAWALEQPCGGHVHLARHTSEEMWKKEANVLSKGLAIGVRAGLFDEKDVRKRTGFSRYGKQDEYRSQPYGYEYRTWPTWLAAPELAQVMLTLAKLLAVVPRLAEGIDLKNLPCEEYSLKVLKLWAGMFKGVDDDAAIMLNLLNSFDKWKKVLFVEYGMKRNWGLEDTVAKIELKRFPKMLPASMDTRERLWNRFINGTNLCYNGWKSEIGKKEILFDKYENIGDKDYRDLFAPIGRVIIYDLNVERMLKAYSVELFQAAKLWGLNKWYYTQVVSENATEIKLLEVYSPTPIESATKTLKGFLLSGILPVWRRADLQVDSDIRWYRRGIRGFRGRMI